MIYLFFVVGYEQEQFDILRADHASQTRQPELQEIHVEQMIASMSNLRYTIIPDLRGRCHAHNSNHGVSL